MTVCECAKGVCFLSVCASVRPLHTCTSKHPLLIFNQKPKTLQSVLVSLVLRLDESNKIDKSLKKKKKLSQLIWNSVSLVSNSGQKGSLFILKNSLKIGFIVGCCFLFFLKLFSCSSCCCRGSKVPLYYWAWMSRPCPPVLGSMGVSKGGLCADMVIPGCDEGPPCISMAWWGWW